MPSIPHPASARRRPNLPIPLGTQFGRYTVIEGPFAKEPDLTRKRYYRCQCECGTVKDVQKRNLTRPGGVSCGCYRREHLVTHGGTGTRLHNIWERMNQRCRNPKNPGYSDYGGRGIVICDAWRGSFASFRDWASANGYQDDLTIERVDVNGNYEPSNCTWIPLGAQARNKRSNNRFTAFGETKCFEEWARDPRCVVSRGNLRLRLKKWDFVRALTTPRSRTGRPRQPH